MNSIRIIVIAFVIAAGALFSWLFWRPSQAGSAASAEPAKDQPAFLAKDMRGAVALSADAANAHRSNVKAHSDAGVHEQFELGRRCYFAQSRAFSTRNIADACQELKKRDGAIASDKCQRIEADLDAASKDLSDCPDAAATPRYFFEATRSAAAAGDRAAQACYVQGLFQGSNVSMPYTQEDLAEYRRVAPSYIAAGLAQGDWRIVSLLARHGPSDGYSPLKLVTKDDPYQAYVMNRLLQLGADGAYAKSLELRIQGAFLSPGLNRGPLLSPNQAAQGAKEARELFHRAFDHQSLLSADPIPCPAG